MPEQNFFTATKTVSSGSATYLLEADRAMSKLNRKQYHQVDAKGNAQVYLIRITQTSTNAVDNSECRTFIRTAPNNYVTKAAVKAWHRARIEMLERQGISLKQLSPYTRHLRMGWVAGESSTNLLGSLYSGTIENSDFAVEAQLDESDGTALTSAMLVDTYQLSLLGDHQTTNSAGEPTKYSKVGCNKAWLDARRQPVRTQTADETSAEGETIDHETNPLYEILAGSSIAEEVSEIVQADQLKQPPWVNDHHYDHMTSGVLFTAVNSGTAECIVEAPLGMLEITINELRSGCDATLTFEVLDIYDM